MELSKTEKKLARTIIEKGLQTEYTAGLVKAEKIIDAWKNKSLSNREAYQSLYDHVNRYDKHIARRYDRMSGSNYLFIIAGQLYDGTISQNDLEILPENLQQVITHITNL